VTELSFPFFFGKKSRESKILKEGKERKVKILLSFLLERKAKRFPFLSFLKEKERKVPPLSKKKKFSHL
jgi:hypothetical protein